MSIDTLTIANRLKAAERDGRTAEEIALVLRDWEDARFGQLVTREMFQVEIEKIHIEFEKVRTEFRAEFEKVRAEIETVRTEMRVELEKLELRLKHDLTLRLGAMIVAAVAVLGGLNIFF